MDALEHLNHMTVLQQDTPKLDGDARGDVAVSSTNPGQRDNPSLLNDTTRPNNAVPEHTSAKQDTPLTWSSINTDPIKSVNSEVENLKEQALTNTHSPATGSGTNNTLAFTMHQLHQGRGSEEHAGHTSVAEHIDVAVNHVDAHVQSADTNPHHNAGVLTTDHPHSTEADLTQSSSDVPVLNNPIVPPVVVPPEPPPVVPPVVVPPTPEPPPVPPVVPPTKDDVDVKCDIDHEVKKEDASSWIREIEHSDGSVTIQQDLHQGKDGQSSGWVNCVELDNKHNNNLSFDETTHHIVSGVHEDASHIAITHVNEHNS